MKGAEDGAALGVQAVDRDHLEDAAADRCAGDEGDEIDRLRDAGEL